MRRLKKILIVRSSPYEENLNSYNVQGVGLARAFCNMGYDCDYLTFTKKKTGEIIICNNGENIARVIYKKWKRFFRTGYCREILNESVLKQYDYIISREYNQIMTYCLSKKHDNVIMYSGPYWNMFMIPIMSFFYDRIFVKKMNKRLKYKFVKSKKAVTFLENKGMTNLVDVGVGLDVAKFDTTEKDDNVIALEKFMKNNDCILYIGDLNDNKNLPFLLEVFKKIKQVRTNVKLVLIGKSQQTLFNKILGKKNESYVEEIFGELSENIKRDILWEQYVPNAQLRYIYPKAKVFLLPSKKEIFGMVMLEAMYFGCPVISSDNGGSSTLIKSNEYGKKIDTFDVDKWVMAICQYLDEPAYTDEVTKKAKKNIEHNYTWDSIAKNMLSYIESDWRN